MQNAVMPNVTIRNVPVEVHAVLSRRAAAAGQSLQQYLVDLLEQQASMLTTDEWLAQVEEGLRGSNATGGWDTVELIHEGREERGARILGD
jgi:plasmid stability protein